MEYVTVEHMQQSKINKERENKAKEMFEERMVENFSE